MIRLAKNEDIPQITEFLSVSNIYSSLFHESLIGTYGIEQSFFKVYLQISNKIDACISVLDNSAFLTLSKASDTHELHSFLLLNPFINSVTMDKSDFDILGISEGFEMSSAELLELKKGVILPQINNEINISPKMEDIYSIMKDFFPLQNRDEFISDMLHRINHGRGLTAAVYGDGKVISCASIFFKGEKAALIGGVCTDKNHRKKGLASDIVTLLADELRRQDILPLITCKSEVGKRIYLTLGFTFTGSRITLSKI